MAIKEKNKILEVNALEIPDELIELPKWVLWRAEWVEKQQLYGKVPYSYAGYKASSTNSDTWTILTLSMQYMNKMIFMMVSASC